MSVNKGDTNFVVCRECRKFALNFEAYVHLMFTKKQSQTSINKGFSYAKEEVHVHRIS